MLQAERIRERLTQIGAESVPTSSAEFTRFLANDIERYARLVRDGRLQPLN